MEKELTTYQRMLAIYSKGWIESGKRGAFIWYEGEKWYIQRFADNKIVFHKKPFM